MPDLEALTRKFQERLSKLGHTNIRVTLTEGTQAVAEAGKIQELKLEEGAATIERIVLKEAKADYEIKLIAPGKGSSAFYPAEVLKRDGPKVFKAGTHVYLNHPTKTEESQRPEGDVKNLAGVLSTTAVFHETHAKGPGLYARMKVFADHGQLVEEKAPHVGMSIRASGNAESGKSKDGLPVLKELISAESVDVVTRAGAGGMILTEAARPNEKEEVEMDQKEITALVESAAKAAVAEAVKIALAEVQKPVSALEARALRGDATAEAHKILAPLNLHEVAKGRVVEAVTRDGAFPVKDGQIDSEKFKEIVMAEAKKEAAYVQQFTGGGRVTGMGPTLLTEATDPVKAREERKRLKLEADEEAKELREAETDIFGDLMGNSNAAKHAVAKGEAA